MKPNKEQLIDLFDLQPHPEGGWYKESYKSVEQITANALPNRFNDNRFFSSAIYFLLERGNFSAFHRIKSDECWHFYAGETLLIYIINESGDLEVVSLGSNITKGEFFQYVVPANCWFASVPAPNSEYCFVGCTVAPAFDFKDFELANAKELSVTYPQHLDLIYSLCR